MVRWLAPLGLFLLWALTLYAYPHLPSSIPAHWNAQGEVTRYGSRLEIFLLPLFVTFLLYPLLALAPRLGGKPSSIWPWLEAAMVWSFTLLQGILLYAAWAQAQGIPFPLGRALFVGVGLVFLALGLLLPHLPPNPVAGVRTPWTLADPEVWRKTQRRAGWVLALLGILAWVVALLGGKGPWLWTWLLALVLGGLYLVLFSLWAGKGEKLR
ncbi:DUF1648 domain-containing protein [Thermus albus]|uniref:DUF1648 domain-containing protein n=1 Tax=Thermus albus TaxID=2908146 RepID=UPI001FAA2E70|nr:DUF1648 domain-containing protein [Thermus albus]